MPGARLYACLANCYLDFMLVYEEANAVAEDKKKDFERREQWREQFMTNLLKAGLEQEKVTITSGYLSAKSSFR